MGDIISFLALLVSLCSVGFAMRSAEQARRANALNMLEEKVQIYEDFRALRFDHVAYGIELEIKALTAHHKLMSRSKLFHNERIAQKMQDYWSDLFDLVMKRAGPDINMTDLLLASRDLVQKGNELDALLVADLRKATQDPWDPN